LPASAREALEGQSFSSSAPSYSQVALNQVALPPPAPPPQAPPQAPPAASVSHDDGGLPTYEEALAMLTLEEVDGGKEGDGSGGQVANGSVAPPPPPLANADS